MTKRLQKKIEAKIEARVSKTAGWSNYQKCLKNE